MLSPTQARGTLRGQVVRLNPKGYGFLKADGEKRDIFAHCLQFIEGKKFDEVVIGDRVEFSLDPAADTNKPRASQITVL
jgi:cold shock CspA family protein